MDLTKEDHQLINQCRTGDKEAFNRLVPRIIKIIKFQIYTYIKLDCNSITVDDATQEILIKLWRSITKLKKTEAFMGWLRVIIRHACYDILRQNFRMGRIRQISLSDAIFENDDSEIRLSIADPRQDVERDFEHKEKFKHIDASLNEMNLEFRNAYELVKMQEFTYEQAADVLNIPMGTVKSRLWRAKQKLHEDMQLVYKP